MNAYLGWSIGFQVASSGSVEIYESGIVPFNLKVVVRS